MSLNTIYNKLFNKSTKTELKTAKTNKLKRVELGKIDDIKEAFDVAGYSVGEAWDDLFYKAQNDIISARDIMRFELTDFYTFREELQAVKDGLDDLGLEYPFEVIELENYEEEIIKKINENHSAFENLGINPMFDRI